MRRLLAAILSAMLLLAGCGGGGGGGQGGAGQGGAAGGASTTARASGSAGAGGTSGASGSRSTSSAAATDASSCPTENTRSFAKTRFAADVGGALFLFHRYIYRPYQDGSFESGAEGRTAALIKAGLAAGATVKLLANARENAAANPTLCKAIAQPLDNIIASARDLATGLPGGRVDDSALKNIESQFGRVQDRAKDAGVQVEERETSLRQ